jgi:hypothetical protein
MGIIWKEGKRTFEADFGKGVINKILNQFGVVKAKSLDEFDTVGLDRHRWTGDWIND